MRPSQPKEMSGIDKSAAGRLQAAKSRLALPPTDTKTLIQLHPACLLVYRLELPEPLEAFTHGELA